MSQAQNHNLTQCEVVLNGARLVVDISGAVYWPAAEAVIVADLHFEKASAFAQRGVALPPYDTAATLDRLDALLACYAPKRLISLGDAFHDDAWAQRMAAKDAERLIALAAQQETFWVTGNHDPTPPKALPGSAHEELSLEFDAVLQFRHEPAPVSQGERRRGELAGHLHPCGKIRQRGRSLRRRCFVHDDMRMILPAFGALTGSLNVRDAAFDDLFLAQNYRAILLGQQRLATVAPKQLLADR